MGWPFPTTFRNCECANSAAYRLLVEELNLLGMNMIGCGRRKITGPIAQQDV